MVKQKHLSFVKVDDTEQTDFPHHMVTIAEPENQYSASVKARLAKERQIVDSLKSSVCWSYIDI